MAVILLDEELIKPLWAVRAQSKMKELGFTQSDIRDHLGLETTGAVGHWFNGRRSPSLKNLDALASFLGMSIPELFANEEDNLELKGDEKNLSDALMLLCRATSIPEDKRIVFFSVFNQLGAKNVINATAALNNAEKDSASYTDAVINILDFPKKTG